ncbi:hypothetical protein [Akkermansia muciniphila]|uniref:hypothetical protein n=1 Tax=Akkermansia muciniphila TaxID=239935 RepID=UPI001BFF7F8A|nr:hypothetical protein [Akkermansia muciniphila]
MINDYAATSERQMTMDFHHLIKGAEGLIPGDSTRKAIIKEESLAHQILQEKPLL